MACGSGCSEDSDAGNKNHQDLSNWQSHGLDSLLDRLGGYVDDEVRVYTVATTRFDKAINTIHHLGSGPNLEGNLASLCTCKHSMRMNHSAADWKGKWILGLTSRAKNNGFSGEHYLFYLMKIDQAFESHNALFMHLKRFNPAALRIKNAVNNRLGDIFQPLPNCTDPLDPVMYAPPHKNHSHNAVWNDDISYKESPVTRLTTPLLVGDIANTFVWTTPMIKFRKKRGVGNVRLSLGQVLYDDLI